MNRNPLFVQTYTIATARVTAASVRSGDTNYTLLVTAGSNGSKIDKIDIIPANLNGTTSVNKAVFIYVKNGSNYMLIKEQLVCGVSAVGTTTYGFNSEIWFDGGLILEAAQELYVGISTYTTVADNVDFIAEVKNY